MNQVVVYHSGLKCMVACIDLGSAPGTKQSVGTKRNHPAKPYKDHLVLATNQPL
jgi:hypothetical protein